MAFRKVSVWFHVSRCKNFESGTLHNFSGVKSVSVDALVVFLYTQTKVFATTKVGNEQNSESDAVFW